MNSNPEPSPQIPDDSSNQAAAVESLSLWGYFVKCLKMSAKFGGRARRREFWGFCLFAPIFLLALFFISLVATAKVGFWLFFLYVNLLFIIAMCLPFMAVTVRRLHDIGKSGWWTPFILFTVTFPLSGLILTLIVIATTHGAQHHVSAIEWAIMYTVLAHVLMGPFMSVWGLSWLCRGSEWSSNKYGECPLDVY